MPTTNLSQRWFIEHRHIEGVFANLDEIKKALLSVPAPVKAQSVSPSYYDAGRHCGRNSVVLHAGGDFEPLTDAIMAVAPVDTPVNLYSWVAGFYDGHAQKTLELNRSVPCPSN